MNTFFVICLIVLVAIPIWVWLIRSIVTYKSENRTVPIGVEEADFHALPRAYSDAQIGLRPAIAAPARPDNLLRPDNTPNHPAE
jgi:uncharacterized membrane protein (DUF106 family)